MYLLRDDRRSWGVHDPGARPPAVRGGDQDEARAGDRRRTGPRALCQASAGPRTLQLLGWRNAAAAAMGAVMPEGLALAPRHLAYVRDPGSSGRAKLTQVSCAGLSHSLSRLSASLPPELAFSALHASFRPGRRFATSWRVEEGTAVPARETGSKSAMACCAAGSPVKTRGPSGNMTMSPRRKVLSARSSGTGFVTSPGALGLRGALIGG